MSSARRSIVFLTIALLLVLGAYANSLNSPFHFDDFHSVEDNVWLRSLSHIPRYFTDVAVFSPLQENRAYRPILLLTLAISHALGGGALWGYHIVTMVLHAAGAWIVGLLARRLLRASGAAESIADGVALFAVALFAVHSLLSEPVNYVSSRSSLQAAVFMFGSILAYVKAREDGAPRWLWIAVLLLLLGMATKIIAMTAPVLCLGWELWLGPSRERRERFFGKLIPLFVVAIGFTIFHELIVGEGSRAARSNVAPYDYFLTESQVWWRYIGLFVWPEDLNADLTMPWSRSILEGPVARSLLATAAIVVFSLFLGRKMPVLTFGVFWYFVALAPTNSIAPLSEPASEHRAYIAVPGLVFVVSAVAAWFLASASRPRLRVAAALGFFLICALGVRTFYRNRAWQSDLALWGDVVARSPDNGRAHLNYGLAQMSRGDLAGARVSFDRCAAEWPGYSFCYINRAALALHEKRLVDAEREIAYAERLAPNNIYVSLWRGEVERAAERWPTAEEAYRRALTIAPGHETARRGLAVSLFMLGKGEEARPLLLELDRAGVLDGDGHYALGYLFDVAGNAPEAIRHYQAALARKPDHIRARYNLGVALQRAGDLNGAIREYNVLARSGSAPPDALFNLALALWQSGDHEGARRVKSSLEAQAPNYPGLAQLAF